MLISIARATYRDDRRKPSLWADHIVNDWLWKRESGFATEKKPDADVTEQIKKMAERDEGWARLYSAEIIHQHPELGTPAIVEMLKTDKNEFVQKALDPDEKLKP